MPNGAADRPPATLQVRLFGRLRITRGDVPVRGLEALKAQELLCYLLLNGRRAHARRRLAELLWGDSSIGQAQKYLRQALWQLAAALRTEDGPGGRAWLQVEDDWIRIDPHAPLWLDTDEFEAAVHPPPASGQPLDAPGFEQRRAAIALYTGDLLEGWIQDWCLYERERFQSMYLAALESLMDYCEIERAWAAGLDYGERILRYERGRERTHRRLMRLHFLAGDRDAALRQYQRCATALREELGVKPSRSTQRLFDDIRADQLEPELDTAPSVAQLHGQLERIHTTLASLQAQIARIGMAVDDPG